MSGRGHRWRAGASRAFAAALLLVAIGVPAALAFPAEPAAGLPAEAPGGEVRCAPESELPQAAAVAAVPAALPYRVFVPNLTRVETPPEPRSGGLLALQSRLQRLVDESPIAGRFAVAVTDLQTNETVGVGLDRRQLAGCLANLFAIVAALRDVDAGFTPLENVDATIRQTIWASDAAAARILYESVGRGDTVAGVLRVAALYDQLGMLSSVLDHPPAFPELSLWVSNDNFVTARELNHALAVLYSGGLLSPALTDYLLEAMRGVKPGLNYLTAVLPEPAVVSHKNGFFWTPEGWVDNDMAIVRFGEALEHGYSISFLSEAVPDLYADIPLGQAIVFEAWAYFSAAYP